MLGISGSGVRDKGVGGVRDMGWWYEGYLGVGGLGDIGWGGEMVLVGLWKW